MLRADNEEMVVISVVENRAREVCISRMDTRNTTSIEIYTPCDNHAYTETLLLLSGLAPDEILLPDSQRQKTLTKKITTLFPTTRVLFISRQYFDQDRGADLLNHVVIGHIDRDVVSKYIVLAGTFCLLRYVENCSGQIFPSNSMRLCYGSSYSGKMIIDRRTALNLELVQNTRTGSQKDSLFGVLNFTKTAVGASLLRKNVLNPSSGSIYF